MKKVLCAKRHRNKTMLGGFLFPIGLGIIGCFSGDLGSKCENELDCDVGLRCMATTSDDPKICTVSCETQNCVSGICINNSAGRVCAAGCSGHIDCDEGFMCQTSSASQRACWPPDEQLTEMPFGLFVDHVEIYSNGYDVGYLENDGSSHSISVYVINTMNREVKEIYPKLIERPSTDYFGYFMCGFNTPGVYLSQRECDFKKVVESERESGNMFPLASLDPGAVSSSPLINFTQIFVHEDVPPGSYEFTIGFVDGDGESWTDEFTVEVR